MENKLTIIAIILMIVGFTFVGYTNLEPTHACYSKEIKAYCFNLSSTGKTCYTLPEKIGGKRCDVSWKEIPFIETMGTLNVESIGLNRIHVNNKGIKR